MARIYLLVVLFLTLLLAACQPPAAPVEEVPSAEADEAAVRESLQRIVDLWNAADLEPMLAGCAEDAVLMPPEAPAVVGKEALRTAWTEFLSQNSSVWELEIEDIEISGDLAFVRGKGSESVTEKETGETEKGDDKSVLILRHW
jgi:ketosteroid isomerase-like protein